MLCTPSQGSPPFRFGWRKDERELTGTDSVHIFVQEDVSSQIAFKSVRSEDTGNYSCTVRNDFGADQFAAVLSVRCESLSAMHD